jgi:hypothetical protein
MNRIAAVSTGLALPLVLLTTGGGAAHAVARSAPVEVVSGASHVKASAPPTAGNHVRITVRGHARGGRYLVAHEIRFGDGRRFYGPVARCMVIKHPPALHHDPFRTTIAHTWHKPGTYHMRYTLAALCEPHVPTRVVKVTVHVTTS